MTRLIDADAIDKRYVPIAPVIDWGTVHYEWVAFIDDINELPTVDAVPVIRCRDCKYLRFTGTVWKCQNPIVMMLCEPNDYCSRAERRGEE